MKELTCGFGEPEQSEAPAPFWKKDAGASLS